MSTPSEGPNQDGYNRSASNPPSDGGGPAGLPSSHPSPPPMTSPYGTPLSNSESNSGGSAQRQPPRFPDLSQSPPWGAGATPSPPFIPAPDASSDSGALSPAAPTGQDWGNRNETYFLPPQFSYNPDQPQPTVAAPEPPKRSRKRLIIAVSGATAMVAFIVAGIVVLSTHKSGDDTPTATGGGPFPTQGSMSADTKGLSPVWTAKLEDTSADSITKTTVGSWLVDDRTVVRGDALGLQAFDIATGKASWTYKVPDVGSTICAMSQTTDKKVGLVRYGPKNNCAAIEAIDTSNGKSLWKTVIPGGTVTPNVTAGDNLVAGSAGNIVTVWNAADGKQLWTVDVSTLTPKCRLMRSGVQGTSVAILADCGKDPVVMMKDATNGHDKWQTTLPPDGVAGARHNLLQAAGPTIVHVEANPAGAAPVDNYFILNDAGQLQPTIAGIGAFGQLDSRVVGQLQVAHVVGNILIEPTATKDPATGAAPKAGLVAFDITTGKQLWQAPFLPGTPVPIVAMTQDQTVVLDDGTAKSGKGPQLLVYSTATGTEITSPMKNGLAPDWAGPSTAYVVGDKLVLLPATPRKNASVAAFSMK